MVFLNSANNLGEYVLKILNAYYTESMLTCGIVRRDFCDDSAMLASQSMVFFGFSLACLMTGVRRKNFRIKRHGDESAKAKGGRAVKKTKLTERNVEEDKKKDLDLKERLEKIRLIILLILLAGVNIFNKLMLYKGLQYISFPTMAIVRSFRLFPTPLGIVGHDLTSRSTLSVLIAAMGIFTYIFSKEEKVENIHFLAKVAESNDFRILHNSDKIKIIRLGLRFLYNYVGKDLRSFKPMQEEELFLQSILNNRLPAQNYSLSLKEQGARYYKNLLLFHANCPVDPNRKEAEEIFEKIIKSKGSATPEMNNLAFSLIKMICTQENTIYFQAFLEKRKISAAVFLCVHSWMEVALEGGQVFLCKKFGIQYEFVITAVNLLSATILSGILFNTSRGIGVILKNFRKDMFISSFTSAYIRLFLTKTAIEKMDDSRMGLQIGMKFFSLFISVIFYNHDFNLGHVLGTFLMFVGCLVNLNLHNILLSRWTLSGHLRRKYL
ncbi:hypothetical protein NEMIN01_1508 [Nematocida minor]|uniref:uncharacterized protein n=1 Tax=Nematocida minor TaxID=1912983 RepID=UPI00221E8C96|nr:uncharacterized protein NEMIN01_1508 [Nematocida minor]KAI5191432.1 hypothetical protein NEMIN01_1508 [Nematocida minor]